MSVDSDDRTFDANPSPREGHGIDPDAPTLVPERSSDALTPDASPGLVGRESAARPASGDARLGRYRLGQRMGAGGMGEVFAAEHLDTGERVALKTLSLATATRLYRFKREFRALADVCHPNLIRLFELVVSAEGPAFFTMELLQARPFVEWVRDTADPGQLPDIGRLEHGLRQLVEGVQHLHAHDCIHRDLKPSNVLVTDDGRVVVLDFGLVSELTDPGGGVTQDHQILGTPAYMAPEQALGSSVGVPADYYAIGVMLFECLTGRLPHEGHAVQQLLDKQDTATPDPGLHVNAAPRWLRTLCVRLLSRDPEARPGGSELLTQLQLPPAPAADSGPIFVGRQPELAVLHRGLRDVMGHGEPLVVHLRGRSGDGKSALVRRFRAELRAKDAVVLHGRCRERETIPYKGVDAVVDALSAHLRRLPREELSALRPSDLDALIRLFPVLDEIWDRPEPQTLGLAELRRLGTVTLRKLLVRVAEARPLLVHIDDFQWADLDSVELLRTLVRPPHAPSVLLLLAYRSDAADSEALRALAADELLAGPSTQTIELRALSAADAQQLARSLLAARGVPDPTAQHARAEAIALRSGGSPFYIAQLAQGGATQDEHDSNLDQIVVHRLAALGEPEQRVLEVVAVFGGPLPAALGLRLAEGATEETIASLHAQGLLVGDPGDNARIETAHDRVREVVLEGLDPSRRTRLHRVLGEHLLSQHPEPARTDAIFAIVNHLDAGMSDPDALPPARRQELAQLNHAAGQRALDAAAWTSARRYLDEAYALLGPWRSEAAKGEGLYTAYVEIAFARARARATLDEAEGDEAFLELLGWSLTPDDYARVARWYATDLSTKLRIDECLEFSLKALARLGLRIGEHPSWPGAVLHYLRGLRVLRRYGVERLRTMPETSDVQTYARMEILGNAAVCVMATDIKMHLALMGRYCQRLPAHGHHDGSAVTMSTLAISMAARGQTEQARSYCELAQHFADHRDIPPLYEHGAQVTLLLALPLLDPIDTVVEYGERVFSRVREVASRPIVEIVGMFHAACCVGQGIPLPRFSGLLDRIEADHDGYMLTWVEDFATLYRRWTVALTEGYDDTPITEGLDRLLENRQYVLMARSVAMMARFFLGDHARCWELIQVLMEQREVESMPNLTVPLYAMMGVIVIVERLPGADRTERRHLRRWLRRYRRTAARWAERCPANFQPIHDVAEGEFAALEGRYDDATGALERARTGATEVGMGWLCGLASERLARLADRRGHALLADAAWQSAREAYEAWGATAVVRRLDEQRAG